MIMFMASFFSWWYTKGWSMVANSFSTRLLSIANTFSVNQLSRTLFAPWRRIISYPNANFQARFRSALDNLFSRSIGFVVRILVLLAALIAAIIVVLLTAIELVIWPVLPFSFVILILIGVLL